jgi:hypothetical protein
MKTALLLIPVLLASSVSFATSKNCSNALQTFSYSLFVSSGGAFMKRETIKFNENTDMVMNNQGKLDISFSQPKVIKSSDPKVTITVANVTGSLKVEGSKPKFNETVICREVKSPACQGPNGQPCP